MRRALAATVLTSAALVGTVTAYATTPRASTPARSAATITAQPTLPVAATVRSRRQPAATGMYKIKHVVIINQENRSFDSYFGTYPGATGLGPRNAWKCVPNPSHPCVKPFHTRQDVSAGGPHSHASAVTDLAGGKMNGFIRAGAAIDRRHCATANVDTPQCGFFNPREVMGYYDSREIPNYWAYAERYTLQDHFFEATDSWSLPSHLYMVSGWSAKCTTSKARSCTPNLGMYRELHHPDFKFGWTDITYLLHRAHVSWRYYVETGGEPDCEDDSAILCPPVRQDAAKPSIWNPLPQFTTVQKDRQQRDVTGTNDFFNAARTGTLPAVSWIVPNANDSEHPPARVSDGQAWVTKVINAVMRGPDWTSTAIFISWDDWGGYYDHLVPPSVDSQGYGIRVPGLVISPYARHDYVDTQVLSTDAYLKFIEDRWLHGLRLDPRTDGRPDPRPTVRETQRLLGNLWADFDFNQKPQKPLILNPRPRNDLVEPQGFPSSRQSCPRCWVLGHRLGVQTTSSPVGRG